MHSDPNADQFAFEVDGAPTPNKSSAPSTSAITEHSTPPSSSASALDTLLNEYRARATSERAKGTLFEQLTRQFLLHDARFAHQFKRRTGDTGIDLVAIPVSHITLAALHARDERLDAKINSTKLYIQEAENIIVAPVSTAHAKTDTEQTTGIQLGASTFSTASHGTISMQAFQKNIAKTKKTSARSQLPVRSFPQA